MRRQDNHDIKFTYELLRYKHLLYPFTFLVNMVDMLMTICF